MLQGSHRRWNGIVLLLTLVMLWSVASQWKAYWQSSSVLAQEPPPASSELAEESHPEAAATEHDGAEEHGVLAEVFHWFNFLLIIGGIWFLGKKMIAPFLDQRATAIRDEMERSARYLEEATQRLSGIENKLQRLDEEIQEIRRTALGEAREDRTRLEEMAEADADKIVKASEQDIAATVKAARRELKVYTAELAVGLAEKRIRETITPQAEKRIFRSFVEHLGDDSKRKSQSLPRQAPPSPADRLPPRRGGA